MSGEPIWRQMNAAALLALIVGVIGCAIGAAFDAPGFFGAWLCAYLLWLGVPLAGVTLVLVHDLSGGAWMASARPALNAAIATMPLATLCGIPAFVGIHSLYDWAQPQPDLHNLWYLNATDFYLRYGVCVVLWNLLAAFALWAPRGGVAPIATALSWLSGVGLILLAFSASFAAIDWILSLEPRFWSSAFPYAACASWFNTGLALVLLAVAAAGWPGEPNRAHMADIARILLATTIFWAYVEFIQFLIVWEENLKSEIPWYLMRLTHAWKPALFVSVGLGFGAPFFVLLWTPSKRSRRTVATVCCLLLASRISHIWWLVLPEFHPSPPFWLDAAAVVGLGGGVLLVFLRGLRSPLRLRGPVRAPVWSADRG